MASVELISMIRHRFVNVCLVMKVSNVWMKSEWLILLVSSRQLTMHPTNQTKTINANNHCTGFIKARSLLLQIQYYFDNIIYSEYLKMRSLLLKKIPISHCFHFEQLIIEGPIKFELFYILKHEYFVVACVVVLILNRWLTWNLFHTIEFNN